MTRGGIQSGNGAEPRFAAFISYSHADAAIAAKLQRKLEQYRLPKHIAALHQDQANEVGRIFRDREDLAAAPSLSDAIRDALAAAEALIVICSPDARASHWVSQEIELFRKLHPDRPVLAALVRGEPGDAFPPVLTEGGLEPLAADLRAEADGWSLGFLKIVAGIANVPLDALVQRDTQRRMRRVMWITAGALAAMLAMGVMTTLAISARNEAARQRASAEGLVEYMLTDLRTKLKGVGRLDVMEGVNRKAMEHYRAQGDLSKLPKDSLERRARILHAMGEDDDRNSQLNDALSKFLEAHRTTAALLRSEPLNADRIFAHAQSEYWVGYAAWQQTDNVTARRHWTNYMHLAARLAEVENASSRAQMELGYSHGNLCELKMRNNETVPEALRHCQLSISFTEGAVKKDTENDSYVMALANRRGWMADVLTSVQRYDEAIAQRQAERGLVDRLLASDPQNAALQTRQTWPMIGLAEIEMERQRFGLAESHLNTALKILDRLSKHFPTDQEIIATHVRALALAAQANKFSARNSTMKYKDRITKILEINRNRNDARFSKRLEKLVNYYEDISR